MSFYAELGEYFPDAASKVVSRYYGMLDSKGVRSMEDVDAMSMHDAYIAFSGGLFHGLFCTRADERLAKAEPVLADTFNRRWQSCNVWTYELLCGHSVPMLECKAPNYCPVCGREVSAS